MDNVVIVGPGRMGLALGAALKNAGAVERLIFYGRGMEPPPHPLFDGPDAAEYRVGPQAVASGTTILILAVPDARLAEVEWLYQKRRSEEHTSELQSQSNLVCRLLLEKKKSDAQA